MFFAYRERPSALASVSVFTSIEPPIAEMTGKAKLLYVAGQSCYSTRTAQCEDIQDIHWPQQATTQGRPVSITTPPCQSSSFLLAPGEAMLHQEASSPKGRTGKTGSLANLSGILMATSSPNSQHVPGQGGLTQDQHTTCCIMTSC